MALEQQSAYGIQVEPLRVGTEVLSEAFPAQVVVPNAQLQVVSAPQAGMIEVLLAAVGDEVRKGEPLAHLQSPGLLEMQRDYLQALTQLNLAQANLERDRTLFNDGIIAERRYLESSSRQAELAASVQQLSESLRLTGLSRTDIQTLAKKRRMTSSLTVASPLDGVVLEQMAVAGQRIDALAPLYRIGSLNPLWLEIHVPLDRLAGLKLGDRVEVSDASIEGKLITIGQGVHAVDQGVLLRAEVTQGTERLRPGQFVQARIASNTPSGFRIPKRALVRSQDHAYLFIQVPDGFRPQPVQVLGEEAETMVVSGDLREGDKVVVSGTAAVKAAWLGGSE
jgi:RND family efflux transporter MFP subunit